MYRLPLTAKQNEAGVPRRTRRPESQVRTGDSQIERHLPGRVVGDRPRVVVMRPDAGVVAEFRDLVDFVLGFDVAVLGDADVDADTALMDLRPVEPGVTNGLIGAID